MATKTTKQETILDEILTYLRRFIVFTSDEQALLVGLWVLHTWTFMESFPQTPWVTPYLYVYSDGPQSGKTTVLRVVRPIVFNAESAGDMTSAAMFTLIEQSRPTLLIDEIDTVFNGSGGGNEAMRRTLNTGYEASGVAYRKVGKEAVPFQTFSAKLLAGIKDPSSDIPETVRTRSIPLRLVKGHPRERFYVHINGPEAAELAHRIDGWIRANGSAIIAYMPDLIESMDPRAFEISIPLLQMAHALGVETEARTALIRMLAPPPPKDKPHVTLLRACREVFDEKGRDRVFTAEILEKLEGWNAHVLGKRLEQFVTPYRGNQRTTTIRAEGKSGKGYYRHQFEEAWSQYL